MRAIDLIACGFFAVMFVIFSIVVASAFQPKPKIRSLVDNYENENGIGI